MLEVTVSSLQERITKSAEHKLYTDLIALSELVRDHPLLSDNNVPKFQVPFNGELVGSVAKTKDQTIFGLLWAKWDNKIYGTGSTPNLIGDYANELFKYWLPIYIQRETDEFLNRVEEIRSVLDEKLPDLPY